MKNTDLGTICPLPPVPALQLISCYTNIIIFVLKWNSGNNDGEVVSLDLMEAGSCVDLETLLSLNLKNQDFLTQAFIV